MATLAVATLVVAEDGIPCPLGFDATVGDSCHSEIRVKNDKLNLGAVLVEYTQNMVRGGIFSTLAAVDRKNKEIGHVDLYITDLSDYHWNRTSRLHDPVEKSFDVVLMGRQPGTINADFDTVKDDRLLNEFAEWIQTEAAPMQLPKYLKTDPDVQAIDEVGCMLICLAGCTASDAGVPCWQLCASSCAWLVLTPW